jgi:hypothetical protein
MLDNALVIIHLIGLAGPLALIAVIYAVITFN